MELVNYPQKWLTNSSRNKYITYAIGTNGYLTSWQQNYLVRKQERQLKQIITTQIVFNNNRNEPLWMWNKKQIFSVRSCYHILCMRGVRHTLGDALWELKIPYKIQMFLWLVNRKAILTQDNLQKRGCIGPGICTMCQQDEETVEHTFTTCTFVIKLWEVTHNLGSYRIRRYNNLEEIWVDIKKSCKKNKDYRQQKSRIRACM